MNDNFNEKLTGTSNGTGYSHPIYAPLEPDQVVAAMWQGFQAESAKLGTSADLPDFAYSTQSEFGTHVHAELFFRDAQEYAPDYDYDFDSLLAAYPAALHDHFKVCEQGCQVLLQEFRDEYARLYQETHLGTPVVVPSPAKTSPLTLPKVAVSLGETQIKAALVSSYENKSGGRYQLEGGWQLLGNTFDPVLISWEYAAPSGSGIMGQISLTPKLLVASSVRIRLILPPAQNINRNYPQWESAAQEVSITNPLNISLPVEHLAACSEILWEIELVSAAEQVVTLPPTNAVGAGWVWAEATIQLYAPIVAKSEIQKLIARAIIVQQRGDDFHIQPFSQPEQFLSAFSLDLQEANVLKTPLPQDVPVLEAVRVTDLHDTFAPVSRNTTPVPVFPKVVSRVCNLPTEGVALQATIRQTEAQHFDIELKLVASGFADFTQRFEVLVLDETGKQLKYEREVTLNKTYRFPYSLPSPPVGVSQLEAARETLQKLWFGITKHTGRAL